MLGKKTALTSTLQQHENTAREAGRCAAGFTPDSAAGLCNIRLTLRHHPPVSHLKKPSGNGGSRGDVDCFFRGQLFKGCNVLPGFFRPMFFFLSNFGNLLNRGENMFFSEGESPCNMELFSIRWVFYFNAAKAGRGVRRKTFTIHGRREGYAAEPLPAFA